MWMISTNTLREFTRIYKTWDKATRSCTQHATALFTFSQLWVDACAFNLVEWEFYKFGMNLIAIESVSINGYSPSRRGGLRVVSWEKHIASKILGLLLSSISMIARFFLLLQAQRIDCLFLYQSPVTLILFDIVKEVCLSSRLMVWHNKYQSFLIGHGTAHTFGSFLSIFTLSAHRIPFMTLWILSMSYLLLCLLLVSCSAFHYNNYLNYPESKKKCAWIYHTFDKPKIHHWTKKTKNLSTKPSSRAELLHRFQLDERFHSFQIFDCCV